jgi:methyl-accepting chemotaxis protein
MNEDVLKMINTLHARLKDVQLAVDALDAEHPEFAQKLDKVDDQVYAIQLEVEKLVPASTEAVESSAGESGETVSDDSGEPAGVAAKESNAEEDESEDKPILSDEMKDNLKDAGRALGGILKDSREVVSELSGTVKDIKGVFKIK